MKGWHYESARHALARRGIPTTQYCPSKTSFRGIPIRIRPVPEGQAYPVSLRDVKMELAQMPDREVKMLKGVELTPPRDAQEKEAWARYVRSKKEVRIFSQPVNNNGKIAGEDPEQVRQHMVRYVLPHELGHHKALTVEGITDKKLSMAEARADAAVAGMSVKDKDAKVFQPMHKEADRRFNASMSQTWGLVPRGRVMKFSYAGRREIGKIQPNRYERARVVPGQQVEVWVKAPKTGPFRGQKYVYPDRVWVNVKYRRGKRIVGEVVTPGRVVPELEIGRKLQFGPSNIADIRRI